MPRRFRPLRTLRPALTRTPFRIAVGALSLLFSWMLMLSLVHADHQHNSHDDSHGTQLKHGIAAPHACVMCLAAQTFSGGGTPVAQFVLPDLPVAPCDCTDTPESPFAPPLHSPDALRGPPALLN